MKNNNHDSQDPREDASASDPTAKNKKKTGRIRKPKEETEEAPVDEIDHETGLPPMKW